MTREVPWRIGMTLYALFAGAWLIRGLAPGIGAGYPIAEVIQDYAFSALLLIPAVTLLRHAERRWAYRLSGVGLIGVAGAYNLQARVADHRFAVWDAVLLHGVGTAACVAGLLLFTIGPADGAVRWRVAVSAAIAGTIGALLATSAPSLGFLATCCLLTPLLALVPVGEAGRNARLVRSISAALAGLTVLVVGAAWITQRLQTPGLLGEISGISRSGPEIWHYPAGLGWLGGQVAAFWVCRFLAVLAFAALAAGLVRGRAMDVDRLTSRAAVYSLLIAIVGAVYVLGVVRVDAAFGLDSDWLAPPQVAAAGLAALAVQPVRTVLARFVDQVVYGRRLSAREVLKQVGALAQTSSGGTEALRSLASLTARTLGADEAAVHLTLAGDTEVTVRWPDEDRTLANEQRTPVNFHGVPVGALAVPAHRGSLPRHRRVLLADLAQGAGVVLHNTAQTLDLRQRLADAETRSAEIRASRWRVVTAQDRERRDLERDLHDSAQPALTSVRLTLGLVNHLAGGGNDSAYRAALLRLRNQIQVATAGLRRTLRGIDPATLTSAGIVAALRESAEALGADVEFDIDPDTSDKRFDRHVEAAVYYCCAEALQNAVKHCPGVTVHLRIALPGNGTTLRFTVSDSGPGFDPDSVSGVSGLQNMADRIAAVDGKLIIGSSPKAGTRVEGTVPLDMSGA
ncbi:MAG TPA: ATP-binding protein [Pseudonocardiaceae bacterium]|nr:ATP-binding protein [Pseudonocardiaceae bacterium]